MVAAGSHAADGLGVRVHRRWWTARPVRWRHRRLRDRHQRRLLVRPGVRRVGVDPELEQRPLPGRLRMRVVQGRRLRRRVRSRPGRRASARSRRLRRRHRCAVAERGSDDRIDRSGRHAPITVSFDAGAAGVDQPGSYKARIGIKEDTPYSVPAVNVTMNVEPPATWGKLTGTITGLAVCDQPGEPLVGAQLVVDGATTDFTLKTDANGQFKVWMDQANGPVEVTISANGYVGTTGPASPSSVVRSRRSMPTCGRTSRAGASTRWPSTSRSSRVRRSRSRST